MTDWTLPDKLVERAKERAARAFAAIKTGYNPENTIFNVYLGAYKDALAASPIRELVEALELFMGEKPGTAPVAFEKGLAALARARGET